MGKAGWLTIRKIPELISDETGTYHKLLKEFFKEHKVCPDCHGRGYIVKKKGDLVDETTVKFQGIPELEKLATTEGVSITDTIREILEIKVWNRKRCKTCRGSRFIAKEGLDNVEKGSNKKGKKITRS